MTEVAGEIRVLHVDDEPDFADLAGEFLEREDSRLDVRTVTGVEEGLAALEGADVGCIVSDYDMPEQNGIDFLERVREDCPDLPFILYTGKGSEEIASEAISAGVTDYLQKETGTGQYAVLANRITNAVDANESATEARRRRHRLEQILKTVPGCVVQLDTEGRFVYANQRAEEVLGLETDAVTDRAYNDPDWNIRDMDDEPIPDDRLPFRRVLETGEALYGYRHKIEWPEGSQRVLLVNGAPLFDEDGDVESVVFSLTDVTDQYDKERELAKTRRRLTLALGATDTGVWEWDLETDEVVWSETLERVMGLDPGEFEGTFDAFADYVHPDDLQRVREEVEHAVETDSMYQTEFRMCRGDGTVRWVAVRGQLARDANGERMVGIHHDITERKERERELEAMERRLDAILENTTTPMFMKDEAGEYVFVNRGYRELFGLEDAEVEGRTDHEIHPAKMAEEVRKNDQTVLSRGEPVETEEEIVVGGERRVFLSTKVPIYDIGDRSDAEDPVAVFGVATDITDRKDRERDLRRQNERLEEFAGVVSHDLRNPLRVAKGRLELARADCDSDHLAPIDRALSRMDRIIDDVLWLAREGRDIKSTEPVPLGDVIEGAWEIGAGETDGAELVVADGGPGGIGVIEADEDRLRQLLENLFRNAVEHGSTSSRPQADDADGASSVEPSVADAPDDAVEHGSTSPASQAQQDTVEHGAASGQPRTDDAEQPSATHSGGGAPPDAGEGGSESGGTDGDRAVTVTVGRMDGGFYVADDGPGIPESQRLVVFEGGYSTSDEGTGFGLSIVERVAEAHGWTVRVTEGSEGGSRFEVTGVDFVE